jgi:peptidoglycan/LPS O-acetylase OafA/YrhL
MSLSSSMDTSRHVVPEAASAEKPQYAYIDCVRGYAILLVITCHLTFSYAALPYPVHRFTVMGWHGVQLFFMASCVTLLMAWQYEAARGAVDVPGFFIRRFFRIAPAYYLASGLYYFLSPPSGGFDPREFLATLGFVNMWHPALAPTVADGWIVVPGGWSISVEFTFYTLFPLIAVLVTSLGRAVLFFLAALVLAIIANRLEFHLIGGLYEPTAVENFLYYWFPNQLPVFAAGSIVFFVIRATQSGGEFRHLLRRHADLLGLLSVLAFFALSYVRLPQWAGEASPFVPTPVMVALPFGVLVLAMSAARPGRLVNPLAAVMGKVSFSAYLLHFAVIRLGPDRFPLLFHVDAAGYAAILAYAIGWIVVVGATFIAAW